MYKQARKFIALWLSIIFVATSLFMNPLAAVEAEYVPELPQLQAANEPIVPQAAASAAAKADTAELESGIFSWDNANVYFVLTDRFLDGDSSNNNSYGRPQRDATGKNIGTFHGGDLKGLTQKLQEGYFTDLGTNVLWISAPYEQMHGWVGEATAGILPITATMVTMRLIIR